MPTLPRPANLILLHPRDQRRPTTLRRRTGTPQLATRAQLLERLETIGELAPSAPLSFLVVKVRGVKETHDAATLMECAYDGPDERVTLGEGFHSTENPSPEPPPPPSQPRAALKCSTTFLRKSVFR